MKKRILFIIPLTALALISCQNKSKDNGITIDSIICNPSEELPVSVKYNDNYFDKSSTKMNVNRMKASYVLSNATTDSSGDEADLYVKSFLNQAGFENVYTSDVYRDEPNIDSIGYSLGYKEIDDDILICCAIKGFNYKKEWYSNFLFGETGPHAGFNDAKNKVLDGIFKYINDNNLNDSSLKFWFTGYSRGGAVSNLVVKSLDQYSYYKENNKLYADLELDYDYSNVNLNIDIDDIYCDTFESPLNDEEDTVNKLAGLTTNIFNFYNPNDWISKAPSYFKRHGIDKNITINVDQKEFKKIISEYGLNNIQPFKEVNMLGLLSKFNGSDAKAISTKTQIRYFTDFSDFIKEAGIKDRKTYVENYQESLCVVLAYFFSQDIRSFKGLEDFINDPTTLDKLGVESVYEIATKLYKNKLSVKDVVLAYLDYCGLEYNGDFSDSLDIFSELTSNIIANDTSDYSHISTMIYNMQSIIYAHYATNNYGYIKLYKE